MKKIFANQSVNRLTLVLFFIYLLVLVWIILFKMQTDLNVLSGSRSINLIPFGESAIVNGKLDISEIINNIVIFIPLGLYISMLVPNWPWGTRLICPFAISLFLEIMQYILAVGSCDITDVINNSLGGILGILIFQISFKIFKDRTIKILNCLASIATVFVLLLIIALFVSN